MFEKVRGKIISLRNSQVILDSDIAELYDVETKRVNEAVKNNKDKFPDDYMFQLTNEEVIYLRSKNSTANISPKSRVLPNLCDTYF
ncbi:ORF6N domain-containing protein [Bacteroides caecigallinarum]|nr:ORF6N domain-containing protein [Bacteroides caecigallinarum]